MKTTIKIEGCPYEDREMLDSFYHGSDYQSVITEMDEYLRRLGEYETGRFTDSDFALIEEIRKKFSEIKEENNVRIW